MGQFTLHTLSSAPAEARPALEAAQRQLGFIPNLYANMAEAPAALEAYGAISGIFDKTSLSAGERQIVALATSVENRCEFCVAVHSFLAKQVAKVDPRVVSALRDGNQLPDPKLHALAEFTRTVVRERGWASGPALERFLAAGYDRRQALEVLVGVAMKTLSNYANHLTGTPLNEQFAAEAWHPKAA